MPIGPCTMKWWPENRKGLVSVNCWWLCDGGSALKHHQSQSDTTWQFRYFKILGGPTFMIPMASFLLIHPLRDGNREATGGQGRIERTIFNG
ncbi:hypothetical protein O9929_18010 [Vibrio lentus]|nr:hypothetical protein [Vibrio lentus]